MAVRFVRLAPELAQRVGQVTVDAFASDPYSWGRALARPPEMFTNYMHNIYMPERMADAAIGSIVALGGEKEEDVAGVLLLEDYHESEKPAPSAPATADSVPYPHPTAIPRFLGALQELFWTELARRTGQTRDGTVVKVSYFAFLAVNERYRRKHIGSGLVAEALAESKSRGFRIAVAFCTSPKSTKLFSNAGFEQWGEIVYRNFKLEDGSAPFDSLPDSCTLMVRMA